VKNEKKLTTGDTLIPTLPEPSTSSAPFTINPNTLRSAPHPTSRLAPKFEPINQLEILQESHKLLGTVAHGKLTVIAQQMQALKKQAESIITEAEKNMQLHKVFCLFEKRAGHTYHLYEKDGEPYFSMLSPKDWRGSPPHKFLGSFRLEADATWTELAQ
jgi:hypothetical protein